VPRRASPPTRSSSGSCAVRRFAEAQYEDGAGGSQRAAGAIGPSLERIGAAEARVERTYRTSVGRHNAPPMRPASRACPKRLRRRSAPWARRRMTVDGPRRGGPRRQMSRLPARWLRLGEPWHRGSAMRAYAPSCERQEGGSAVAAASVSPALQSALDVVVASVTVTMKAAEPAQRQPEGERRVGWFLRCVPGSTANCAAS
jgi:hypothetical protein